MELSLNIGLNYFLIIKFQAIGAAIATGFTIALINICRFLFFVPDIFCNKRSIARCSFLPATYYAPNKPTHINKNPASSSVKELGDEST